MSSKRKNVTIVLAIIAFAAILFSVAFVTVSANHEHAGERCSICYCIHSCEETLKLLLLALLASVLLRVVAHFVSCCASLAFKGTMQETPVKLKVKLSN